MSLKLLFLDPNEEWLRFVESTLSDSYEVTVAPRLDLLFERAQEGHQFDLIFIGLTVAEEHMKVLSDLARSSTWRFVVLFPGFPDRNTARIFFKAGMRDLLSKPYDAESLKKMVQDEISYATREVGMQEPPKDDEDYAARVRRLWESVQATRPTYLS